MKVVILAGGKGTRIASIYNEIPKAMIPIAGKPVLEYQIELARRYGFLEIILVTGHLGDVIENYFKDGNNWGVSIEYFREEVALGTAGALPFLKAKLSEDFFVFYGDTIMDIALDEIVAFHKEKHADASLFLHPNDHPYDSDLVEISENGRITNFFSKPHPDGFVYKNLVNAALYILSPKIIEYIPINQKTDFGKDIFPCCLISGVRLFGYISAEYVKDMGSPDRLLKIESDVISGKVKRLNNQYIRKAIFIDRDGVINKEVNNLKNASEFELLEGVAEAIRIINHSDFLAIVITNQPVIAKGMCTFDELKDIHNKMEHLLGLEGAYLNKTYFCPHHPDSGFDGEVKELKIECTCRKPNIGMIEKATEEFNIDINSSYFIGDSTTDIQTGINAGLLTILVNTGYAGNDKRYNILPSFNSENLLSAINEIMSIESNAELFECINKIIDLQKTNKKVYIAVGGLSRSGKSTMVSFLKQKLKKYYLNTTTIELDNWIVPVENRNPGMTVKDRYQYEIISNDILQLLKTEKLTIYPYQYQTRSLAQKEKNLSLKDIQVVFIDGVIALDHPIINKISHFKIYVEIDESLRKKRFVTFYHGKGLNSQEINLLYKKRLIDEESFVLTTKDNADIIIKL